MNDPNISTQFVKPHPICKKKPDLFDLLEEDILCKKTPSRRKTDITKKGYHINDNDPKKKLLGYLNVMKQMDISVVKKK